MPAKTPMYLKTTTPRRGKKLRLRDVLSGDMISPPLGDVRHSAHVGPEGEGDMFGDVGFLQGKMNMLSSLNRPQNNNGRSHSMERCLDEGFASTQNAHDYSYNGHHYHHSAAGLLKTTISMPVFIAHEQAPPKPPRLHLDDPTTTTATTTTTTTSLSSHFHQLPDCHTQSNTHRYAQSNGFSQGYHQYQQQHPVLYHCENGGVGRLASEPCRDISISPALRRLVPSSGSFSEVSSEDSASDTCGPLEPRQGLSLDSDAGLSNEDLRSERSDSPCATGHAVGSASFPSPSFSSSSPAGMSRSGSMAGLDLDLGPSILEDVLSIMDRYKTVDDRCEL
ncbi:cdc42 effector protein 3 [Lampris incognitus]|uniref:cdc42 effector protein 3 n=1 Tax=Lampris incognitus TaxID=2546036 RepID=UPI0024B4E25F|nr:cdc42 effector protein 3 [Lampris incognitus]